MSKEDNISPEVGLDFIRSMVEDDLKTNKHGGRIQTRFPPEPNGYLHLGHAKSICLNFGIAEEYKGKCNLRFDDTNPEKESQEYVDSIINDVQWLGFQWDGKIRYASDYFEQLYLFAEQLINDGYAYVDSLSADEIREYRGTLTKPGKNSPDRDRPAKESLDLFRRMRAGEFPDGSLVLRAKADMSSPNIVMRDPTLYRIRREHHHRTGDDWCIYPMYDFTHCISDSLEEITHSLCSLEFVNNREIYEWILDKLDIYRSKQTEFARLNISNTILSKRKLIQLVNEGHVDGWNDPRMPTLSGLKRRGVPPAALREFCKRIGVARSENMVEYSLLDFCIREELNRTAKRTMGVLDPVKLVIENYPEDKEETFALAMDPENPEGEVRTLAFSNELWIERSDFMEEAPKKYFRLTPGQEVRLRGAYYVRCTGFEKDEKGKITKVLCSYDPESRGGGTPDNRRVRGTIHWVSAKHAKKIEVRLYEHLFLDEDPEAAGDFLDCINPDSLKVITAYTDPITAETKLGETVQFERLGYFCPDPSSSPEKPVFNRTTTLRDTWARIQRQQKK